MKKTDKDFYDKIDKSMSEILAPPPVSSKVHGQYNYKKDKIEADKGEDFIIGFLESVGFKFVRKSVKGGGKNKIEHKEFDLLMTYNEQEIKYEIKTDMYSNTGNLVVEFEDRGKPSGINVTTSDYFTTYFSKIGEIWNIKTDKLKSLISENNFKAVPGGDDKKARMYKIPRNKFKQHFRVHKVKA